MGPKSVQNRPQNRSKIGPAANFQINRNMSSKSTKNKKFMGGQKNHEKRKKIKKSIFSGQKRENERWESKRKNGSKKYRKIIETTAKLEAEKPSKVRNCRRF